ncbi:hypothetical protein CKO25_04155 [Thiocapsa imhoffii]|uniref:YrhK domain-containing protein n=1 Tax=Thiocapsa imhoffii TaxID=382777 RepID=A0A9X0WGR5_9GAMM|nr:hypothetical protein [Thiocapsa imhoffii]MBK1643867.1 hypothetical protein [Thiocapsa imhoffii]
MKTTANRRSLRNPFISRVVQTLDDGHQLVFLSRRQRKRLRPFHLTPNHLNAHVITPRPQQPHTAWLRLWAPQSLAWWIALLFLIGSACFAYGGFAANWPELLKPDMATTPVIGVVFFVGSLFFTSAAGLQLLEAINGDIADLGTGPSGQRRAWHWWAWKPHNAGYLSSLIQFAGTLLFNFNTGDALLAGLGWVEKDVLIWTPDMIGSLCFLAASYLALMEISHGWWSFEPRQVAWWVVMINLAGSIAFQVSAFYAFFPPPPDVSWSWIWDANLWTFIGALCFFVASYLMIPELFDADSGKTVVLSPHERLSA